MVEDQDTTQDEVSQERLAEVTEWAGVLQDAEELVEDGEIDEAVTTLDQLGGAMIGAGAFNLAFALAPIVTEFENEGATDDAVEALDAFSTAAQEAIEDAQ